MLGWSNLITVGVESFAVVDRHLTKKKLFDLAQQRQKEHHNNNNKRPLVIVSSPNINELKKLKDNSCIVFVDCALELCDTEEKLKEFWNELKRISGTNTINCKDLFVHHIQHWSSTRLFLDPKVRWIILEAPPNQVKVNGKVKLGEIKYKPYGKRNTVLSDVKSSQRNKK